jgi:Arc/MetJ family transcription regulator
MRTNIDIDDKLIADAMKASGLPTKKAAVEAGLRLLLQVKRQKRIRGLFGKVAWEGNLEESRQS